MSAPRHTAASHVWLATLLAALCATVAVAESWQPRPQLDDSFITYRYADHLVGGAGLVWNPGERVEAITNLLWALLVAALGSLGVAAPLAGHALGVGCLAALLLATYALARATTPPQWAWVAALAPWVVLASPALPYFATSGMETLGFLALGVGALAAHAHGHMRLATGLLCLGIVIRPDAGVIAAAVLGAHLLERGPLRLASWGPVACFGATIAVLTAFRVSYYGSPVPNTFYAKVGGIPLPMVLAAARVYLLEAPAILLLPAVLTLRSGGVRSLAPSAAIAGTLLYVVLSGGTALTFSRFLSPLLPVLAALAARTTAHAFAQGERLAPLWLGCLIGSAAGYLGGSGALLAAVAAGATCSALPPGSAARWLRTAPATLLVAAVAATAMGAGAQHTSRFERVHSKRQFDRLLLEGSRSKLRGLRAAGIAPGSQIGAAAIGVLGYYGDYRVLDLLGLADPVIARSSDEVRGKVLLGQGHLRSNANYVFEQRPEALLIGRRAGPQVTALTAVRALWEDPRLDQLYRWDPRIPGYRLRRPARAN